MTRPFPVVSNKTLKQFKNSEKLPMPINGHIADFTMTLSTSFTFSFHPTLIFFCIIIIFPQHPPFMKSLSCHCVISCKVLNLNFGFIFNPAIVKTLLFIYLDPLGRLAPTRFQSILPLSSDTLLLIDNHIV